MCPGIFLFKESFFTVFPLPVPWSVQKTCFKAVFVTFKKLLMER